MIAPITMPAARNAGPTARPAEDIVKFATTPARPPITAPTAIHDCFVIMQFSLLITRGLELEENVQDAQSIDAPVSDDGDREGAAFLIEESERQSRDEINDRVERMPEPVD